MRVTIAGAALLALACGGLLEEPQTKTDAKAPPAVQKRPPAQAPANVTPPCQDEIQLKAPEGCVLGTISCGDVVEGNNRGLNKNWGDRFYQAGACTPRRYNYDLAPEAVWRIKVPANTKATVTLDSPCADLDVVAMAWKDTHQCPSVDSAGHIFECEMETDEGSGEISLFTVNNDRVYLVGVDGKEGETGDFSLSVNCSAYR